MKYRINRLLMFTLSLGLLTSACTKTTEPPSATSPSPETQAAGAAATQDTPGTTISDVSSAKLATDEKGLSQGVVIMKTTKGAIKFRLFSKDAPNTVRRFAALVQSKFYNGITFHRVIPDFVVQAGDPKSRNKNDPTIGSGGSGVKLRAEFNGRKHVRGAVAMARAADPDSADSQFYITMGPFPHLDGKYTVIGQVVDYGEKSGEKDVLDRLRQWDEIVDMHIE